VSTTYSVTKHSDVVISGMQYVLFTIHIIIAVLTMCKLTLSSMSLTLKKQYHTLILNTFLCDVAYYKECPCMIKSLLTLTLILIKYNSSINKLTCELHFGCNIIRFCSISPTKIVPNKATAESLH